MLDAYDRTARLAPAYIALFPVSILVVAIFGGEDWWQRIVALIVAAGLPVLLADMVRNIGKPKQAALWKKWGGAPTTQLLRHYPAPGNPLPKNETLRDARRKHVERITHLNLPTADEERTEKTKADEVYEAAIALIRPATSNQALVARENRLYGFWRNLFGGRGFVALMGLLAIVVSLVLYILGRQGVYSVPWGWLILDALVGVGWLFMAWLVITEEAVRRAANNYATEVLQALPVLPSNEPLSTAGTTDERA